MHGCYFESVAVRIFVVLQKFWVRVMVFWVAQFDQSMGKFFVVILQILGQVGFSPFTSGAWGEKVRQINTWSRTTNNLPINQRYLISPVNRKNVKNIYWMWKLNFKISYLNRKLLHQASPCIRHSNCFSRFSGRPLRTIAMSLVFLYFSILST